MVRTPIVATALVLSMATMVAAQDDNTLVVEGMEMVTEAPAPAHMENVDTIYSGWRFRSAETQEIQTDDFANSSFVFIQSAENAFVTADGTEGKACADCHADVADFAGLRATLPRVENGALVTMEELINECRTDRMGAEPLKWTGGDMTAMTALIGLQSRGMPMNVAIDGDAAPFWEQGKDIYYARSGQLDMACATCHEDNYDNMIRADHLSQGQINGFPTYRMKNTKLNSIHARFQGCMRDVRATPYGIGSDEFKALELYVASRSNGLSVETPSVRN